MTEAIELGGDRDNIRGKYFDIFVLDTLELFFGPAEKVGMFEGI